MLKLFYKSKLYKNRNLYSIYGKLYRFIKKHFKNFKYSNEFDDIIKRILDKIFNNYYVNREKYIYNIDNLYKKYDISKYNFIKKKYGINKKEDLIDIIKILYY